MVTRLPSTALSGLVPTVTGINVGEDDLTVYDEGTWTPVVKIGTTDITSAGSGGNFTRVGNVVMFTGALEFDRDVATGNVTVEGLPVASNANNRSPVLVLAGDYVDNEPTIVGIVGQSTSTILLYVQPDSTGAQPAQMSDTQFNAGARNMRISGFYFV